MRRLALLLCAVFAVGLGAGRAYAIDTQVAFTDPVLQARYETLTQELRCPMCQNNSIADSNAGIAADLRTELRGLIAAGKSDEEIRAFMTARYGDFVLYKPPVTARTYLLWASPVLLLVGALAAAFTVIVRRSRRPYELDDSDGTGDGEGHAP